MQEIATKSAFEMVREFGSFGLIVVAAIFFMVVLWRASEAHKDFLKRTAAAVEQMPKLQAENNSAMQQLGASIGGAVEQMNRWGDPGFIEDYQRDSTHKLDESLRRSDEILRKQEEIRIEILRSGGKP